MTALDNLIDEIFDSRPHALQAEFAGWARDSRRFRAFADVYRAKIRAKLRNARDESSVQDLRAELAAAALLLREERFTLEYETYAAAKQRGPDFTVTFKTHTPFNVEVRRVRAMERAEGTADAGRLMTIIADKVAQMPPSIVNLLWLTTEREIAAAELDEATIALRRAAERKDEPFFARRGFQSAADFLASYRRLSGVVLCRQWPYVVWANPIGRHRLPPEIAAAVGRLGAGDYAQY
jgi:hypothetical protein